MTKEPVTLSDWIQFLNGKAGRGNTYYIGMFSIGFAFITAILIVFSLSLNIASLPIGVEDKENLLGTINMLQYLLFGGAMFFIIFASIIRWTPISDCGKAIRLLNKLMKNEKGINIDDIRKEWFKKRGKKMFKDISIYAWREIRTIAITIGIGILAIGLILMKFGTEFFPITYSQWLTSFGLGVLALGVAFHSIVISKESDKKMNAIAYATFDEAIREIEDRRLTLQERLPILQNKMLRRKIDIPGDKSELNDAINEFAIFFQYSIWKCKTYLDRAMNFKEYLRSTPNDREQIIHQLDCLFFIIAPIKKALNLTLHESYKSHIQSMYDTITEFDEFHENENRKNRIEHNRSYLKDEGETTYQIPNWQS